ncbi:hypothetical protein Tco_0127489 [Tanacetum coccineum]
MANPDNEPMWAADRVVTPTPGPIITIPATANEFAIKGNHLTLVKENQFDALYDQLLREIQGFSQHVHETLTACLYMKELLRNSHGHGLTKGNIIKIFYYGLNEIAQKALNAATGGIFLYKTPNQAYQLFEDKVLLKFDSAKNQKLKAFVRKTVAFANESNSNYDTNKIMARMDVMTIKMDAEYKEMKSRTECNHYRGNH